MSTKVQVWLSRTEVRRVECPACQARAGEKCIGARGKRRERNHLERVQRAGEVGE